MLSWPQKLILAFFLGVFIFSPWELLLESYQVIEFKTQNPLGIPWWLPVFYGSMTLIAVFCFSFIDYLLHIPLNYRLHYLALEYLLISSCYFSILFFHSYPYFLAIGLFFLVIVRLIFFHKSLDIIYFTSGACVGSTYALILGSLGIYRFTEPDFLGMPYWLPIFWGNVALMLRRLAWSLRINDNGP